MWNCLHVSSPLDRAGSIRAAIALRIRTSYLHFEFARRACSPRSRGALAFRVRMSRLRFASARRL
jgi:hypothetical protein